MNLCETCVNKSPEFFCSFVKRGGNKLDRIGEYCTAYGVSLYSEIHACDKYEQKKNIHADVS